MIREMVTTDAIPSVIQMGIGKMLNILFKAAIIAIIVILRELADQAMTKCIMTTLRIMISNKNKP